MINQSISWLKGYSLWSESARLCLDEEKIRLCCYLILDKTFIEVFEIAECARSSMDRASDFGSEGWGFKSLRAHHIINRLHLLSPFPLQTGHGSRKTSSIDRITKVSRCKMGVSEGRLNIAVAKDLLHGD